MRLRLWLHRLFLSDLHLTQCRIRGGGFPQKIFRLFGPQFDLKISGGGGRGWVCPSPGSATVTFIGNEPSGSTRGGGEGDRCSDVL